MLDKLKQLAGESLIYGVANIVSQFLSILLWPIYTRMFLPSDYGIIALMNTSFNLIAIVVKLGFESAMMVFYHEYKDENRKRPIAVRVWTQTIATIITCAIILPFSTPFSNYILKEDGHQWLFVFATFNLIFSILPYTVIGFFRLQRKALPTVYFTIISSVLTLGLNILFVVVFKQGLNGIFLSTMLSSLCQTIYCFYAMRGWLSIKWWDSIVFKRMLRFALPLMPTSIAYWLTNSSAMYFLNHFLSKSEVGLYQIATSLASVMFLITGSFQMAWGPFSISLKDQPDSKELYAKVLFVYSLVTGILLVGFAALSKTVLSTFTTAAYVQSFLPASILAFSYIITGYSYVGSIGLNIAKTSIPFAISIILSSVITVAGFYFLIPVFKIEGAAIAILIGQLIVPIYTFVAAQKVYPIPYNFLKAILLMTLSAAVAAVSLVLNFISGYALTFNLIIVICFIASLLFFNKNSVMVFLNGLKGNNDKPVNTI